MERGNRETLIRKHSPQGREVAQLGKESHRDGAPHKGVEWEEGREESSQRAIPQAFSFVTRPFIFTRHILFLTHVYTSMDLDRNT